MIKVAMPKPELITAKRVLNGIIVVDEDTNLEDFDPKETKGRIMFQEHRVDVTTGFGSKRAYFLRNSVENLRALIEQENLVAGGKLIGYKLIIKESTEPYFEAQPPKVYPSNHNKAGNVCTHLGAPIYRQIDMVPTTSPETDDILKLDREEQFATSDDVNVDAFENEGQA